MCTLLSIELSRSKPQSLHNRKTRSVIAKFASELKASVSRMPEHSPCRTRCLLYIYYASRSSLVLTEPNFPLSQSWIPRITLLAMHFGIRRWWRGFRCRLESPVEKPAKIYAESPTFYVTNRMAKKLTSLHRILEPRCDQLLTHGRSLPFAFSKLSLAVASRQG